MGMLRKRLVRLSSLGLLLAVLDGGGTEAAMVLEVGEKAPDFTLPSTMGKEISLSQFRGKSLVLIEFYVADFGPT